MLSSTTLFTIFIIFVSLPSFTEESIGNLKAKFYCDGKEAGGVKYKLLESDYCAPSTDVPKNRGEGFADDHGLIDIVLPNGTHWNVSGLYELEVEHKCNVVPSAVNNYKSMISVTDASINFADTTVTLSHIELFEPTMPSEENCDLVGSIKVRAIWNGYPARAIFILQMTEGCRCNTATPPKILAKVTKESITGEYVELDFPHSPENKTVEYSFIVSYDPSHDHDIQYVLACSGDRICNRTYQMDVNLKY